MKQTTLLTLAASSLALVLALPVAAAMKAKPADPAAAAKMLDNAASEGGKIFAHDTFGGHRKIHGMSVTCETCHLGGGQVAGKLPDGTQIPSLVNAAAIFPRYNPKLHSVVTLGMQIQHCVKGGMGGRPPALDSKTLVDMVAYLHSIAKGQSIDAGGMPK